MCFPEVTIQERPFLSANLRNCYSAWESIGTSESVLSWVRHGVPLPFKQEPDSFHLQNKTLNAKEAAFVSDEIKHLVDTGAIVECQEKPKCVSPISVAPKKNNGYRLIVDLRVLNGYCKSSKFL